MPQISWESTKKTCIKIDLAYFITSSKAMFKRKKDFMKKTLVFLLIVALLATVLVGCGNKDNPPYNDPDQSQSGANGDSTTDGNETVGGDETTNGDENNNDENIDNDFGDNSVTYEDPIEKDGFTFRLLDDETAYYLSKYEGTATKIEIPSTVGGLPVIAIAENVFMFNKTIQSVTIPGSVKDILRDAFNGCSALEEVIIEEGVKTIQANAFSSCDKLTSILIPSTVESIGNSAFAFDYNLSNVVLPNGLKVIDDYAFASCYSIAEISIPDSVTEIGVSAFAKCISLETFTFPNKVTVVKENTFINCDRLSQVILNDNITEIENGAFKNCKMLYSIEIPNSVTTIGKEAFSYCYGLVSVTLGSGLTSVGERAFDNCYKLVEVINKSSLSIESISNSCIAKYSAEIHSGDSKIEQVDGFLFKKINGINYLLGYTDCAKTIVLPNDYKGESYQLYKYSFYHRDDFVDIVFSDGITQIGEYSFFGCDNIRLIKLSDSITYIGTYGFYGCDELISITLGKNCTGRGQKAFSECPKLSELVNLTSEEEYPWGNVVIRTDYSRYSFKDSFVFFSDNEDIRLISYFGDEVNVVLPETFNGKSYEIANNAFVTTVESIIIPKTIKGIGANTHVLATCIIYFGGTDAEWNAVEKATETFADATIYYYSETAPSAEGNYWHYIDGVPATW